MPIALNLLAGSFESQITTLLVGVEEREYRVHQDLLSSNSPYFAAAVKEEWEEGQERRISLLDDSAAAVDLYIQWIYNKRIFCRQPLEEIEKGQEELGVLIDGFIFGEKIQDGDFKDAIIDALIASVSTIGKEDRYWYPSGEMVDRAYKGTPPGSPLRRLLIDMHVHHGCRDWVEDGACPEFLIDLVRDLLNVCNVSHMSDPTTQQVSSCPYHHHGDDFQCYREKILEE
ncbi:hypothetical protein KC323_g9428 [Hortaea werneckii]|nr:hypothetical protein KC323_g9428 [Hortaea werneckii]